MSRRKSSSSLQSHDGLFWAFRHKKYRKTSGAKLRSAMVRLKWSDDSEFHVALEERRERDMKKKKQKSMWVKLDFFGVDLKIYSQICVVPNLSTSI